MRITFNPYNLSRTSFSQNSQSYNWGFNHGKNDGLVGSRSNPKQDKNIEMNKEEYEKGYSRGYSIGKSQRQFDTTTISDIIQELVDNGTPREQAVYFASQYLGGW